MIVNAFNPWLSKTSIDKGANWGNELTTALAEARAGIICLTPSNLAEPWILFEAGAIAKTVKEKPLACTLLIDLKSSDLANGPLALFQDTKLTRDDLLQLVKTLNSALGKDAIKEAQLENAFYLVWPKLEKEFENLPSDTPSGRPRRSEREMIEDILDTVRSTSQRDADLLGYVAEGVTEITKRLPSARINYVDPYIWQTGRGGFVNAVSSFGQNVGTGIPAAGWTTTYGDASTSGSETPIVPPASKPNPNRPRRRRRSARIEPSTKAGS